MAPDTGLGLDEQFDLLIDSTGDIDRYEDVVEMHKDLAGAITIIIERDVIGTVLRPNDVAIAETEIENRMLADERVIGVVDVTLEQDSASTEVDVYVEVDSIYGRTSFSV